MKALAIFAGTVIMFASSCGNGGGTGTQDNPIKYRKPGQFCSTVGGFALTKQGDLLICARKTDQASPRWDVY